MRNRLVWVPTFILLPRRLVRPPRSRNLVSAAQKQSVLISVLRLSSHVCRDAGACLWVTVTVGHRFPSALVKVPLTVSRSLMLSDCTHNRHDISLCETDQWHEERRRQLWLTQPLQFDQAWKRCFTQNPEVTEKTSLSFMDHYSIYAAFCHMSVW